MNTLKLLKNYFFPILLVILFSFLAWRNYVPGTWLSGWDTLHPEFNIALYLKRIFFGVWQEHQGLGAVASQSHAAEITRMPIILVLSFLFSPQNIRYIFLFLTIPIGSLGVYFLTNYLLSQYTTKYVKSSSFVAALFYVLNLATLQQYYVPLEMFTVHFATLPWLFLFALKYLREGGRGGLIAFMLITLFSTSMSHTATLFYAYFLAFGLFIFSSALLSFRKISLKRGVILLVLTIVVNLFWLAPNIYYVVKESHTVSNSKISLIFSDEAFLQSKAFGDYKNLGLLKNFLYNWREYSFEKNTFVDLLDEWNTHFNNPGVVQIGYSFFVFALLGIPIAFIKKSKYAIAFLPVLFICVAFWINENPPFTQAFSFLRENLPLFKEAVRFPFTKFSILLVLCLSVFIAYSSHFLMDLFGKIKLAFVIPLIAYFSLFYYMLPAFNGNFVSPSMKVSIPPEYFQAFKWFDGQDKNGRVAKLPVNTFWGWNYYSWGYQGGGFTWFGIAQPTLDREFDRWGLYNEDFYWQISQALYGNDLSGFVKTLQKYQVKYLILDESLINAGGDNSALYVSNIKKMLLSSNVIKEAKVIGFLTIYETNLEDSINGLSVPKTIAKVNQNLTYSQVDPIYSKFGDYIQDEDATGYPFVNMDRRGDVKINANPQNLTFENIKTKSKIVIPNKNFTIENLLVNSGFEKAYNCDLKKIGSVNKVIQNSGVLYEASGGGVSCDYLDFPNMAYNKAYALRIAGVNQLGRSLKIYLYNQASKKMDLEELLPSGKFDQVYFLYPKNIDGKGYSLNFETRSYGRIASTNLVTNIEIYEVDYDLLSNIYLQTQNPEMLINKLIINNVQKYGTWLYKVDVQNWGLIQLGQGYDTGWKAFPIRNFQSIINVPVFNSELKHVKVNSWSNGWLVDAQNCQNENSVNNANCQLIIVFWPQLLEWGGGLLGLMTLGVLVFRRRI